MFQENAMDEQKKDAKNNILPHTKAKLELYEKYLDRYLAILGASKWISKINIYDVFCGTGIYKNGKAGSPIIAFNIIEKNRIFCNQKEWKLKPILLSVNDHEPSHIAKVKHYIEARNNGICEVHFDQLDAEDMFQKIISNICNQSSKERNLVFIDPYGYQNIHRDGLYKLLSTRKTEIILFLPVAHMHRFKKAAVKDFDNPSYVKLREFINDFFPKEHPVTRGDRISIRDFIAFLKQAFSFSEEFFTVSYHIQRSSGNLYALFFITSNVLGLEKIVDVIWELDPNSGQGFYIPKRRKPEIPNQTDIFDIIEYPLQNPMKLRRLRELEQLILDFIADNSKDNEALTKHVLLNSFKISQANETLKKLQKADKISVIDASTGKTARKGSFYLGYKYINQPAKRVIFKRVK